MDELETFKTSINLIAYAAGQGYQLDRKESSRFAFACFETPTRFLVRAGTLDKNPVHLYLTLQRWQWRVTTVFV
jgi:hypothetical protein